MLTKNILLKAQKPLTYPTKLPIHDFKKKGLSGHYSIIIATGIMAIWAISLIILMTINIEKVNIFIILAAILWQTFLYTGLFITAHDAMHGAIFPSNLKVNHLMGSLCLILYGCLSYQKLLKKHWQHHKNPASKSDPDFHNGKQKNLMSWYFHFMKGYWSWKQILTLMLIFNIIVTTLHIPENNLKFFWIFPSLLSSLQLFYFGTFEPHCEPKEGYKEPHNSQTMSRPVWLSFLTCYHFGYHEEHHEYSNVPWWELPKVYKWKRES
jgi:beta-carotene/zeaxanthin 4-ketolase